MSFAFLIEVKLNVVIGGRILNRYSAIMISVLLVSLGGCTLQEIRSKSKFGPEYRHRGSNRTDSVRWYAQQGVEFKWDKGINTSVTYRRRDEDNGNGDHDNGVWFELSFPIWHPKKPPDQLASKIEELEMRLAQLEAQSKDGAP